MPQKLATAQHKNIFSTYEKRALVGSNIVVEDQRSLETYVENGKTFDLVTTMGMNNTKSLGSDEKTFDLANHLNSCVIPISNLNPTLQEDFFVSPADRS